MAQKKSKKPTSKKKSEGTHNGPTPSPSPPPTPTFPPNWSRLAGGTWGLRLNGSVLKSNSQPQEAPTFEQIFASISRIRFDTPTAPSATIGQFSFYTASNHGGNITGRIPVADAGDGFRPPRGYYTIYDDQASGWILIPLPRETEGVPNPPQYYARYCFIITNGGRELFLVLTEDSTLSMTNPTARSISVRQRGNSWGTAKRD